MKKVVAAGMIGNGLEWYDYVLYGYLASIISTLFFPAGDELAAQLATWGIFAAGFIMRPVGAILFGYLGDRHGRKVALAASVLLMALPTGLMGMLPTYESIGLWAPALLTILRLIQGIALGGEFSGAITYVVEHAPPHRKGLAGSTTLVSMMLGILLGSGVATGLASMLSPEDFAQWGWRVPFIIGMVIGIVGLYIRMFLDESPEYAEAKAGGHISQTPVRDTFSAHKKELAIAIGVYAAVTLPFYLLVIYMNSYMNKVLGYPLQDAMIINTISLLVVTVILPIGAHISDKVGRKPVMLAMIAAYLILAYPIFWLLGQMDFMYALAGQVLFGIVLGFYVSPIAAILVEIFPTNVRYTGMGLACNICAATLGGTAPMLATWLIGTTGDPLMPAWLIVAAALISLWALLAYREKPPVRPAAVSTTVAA